MCSPVRTAVRIKEADELVLVPADKHTFDTAIRRGSGRAMHRTVVFGHAASTFEAHRPFQADRGCDDGVHASLWSAVVRLRAGHANNLLARPGVEDEDGSIVVADHKRFPAHGKRT